MGKERKRKGKESGCLHHPYSPWACYHKTEGTLDNTKFHPLLPQATLPYYLAQELIKLILSPTKLPAPTTLIGKLLQKLTPLMPGNLICGQSLFMDSLHPCDFVPASSFNFNYSSSLLPGIYSPCMFIKSSHIPYPPSFL